MRRGGGADGGGDGGGGGDGFLFSMPDVSRRVVATVADGLVPALQRRGLVRRKYEFEMLRDNLMAF